MLIKLCSVQIRMNGNNWQAISLRCIKLEFPNHSHWDVLAKTVRFDRKKIVPNSHFIQKEGNRRSTDRLFRLSVSIICRAHKWLDRCVVPSKSIKCETIVSTEMISSVLYIACPFILRRYHRSVESCVLRFAFVSVCMSFRRRHRRVQSNVCICCTRAEWNVSESVQFCIICTGNDHELVDKRKGKCLCSCWMFHTFSHYALCVCVSLHRQC